MSLVLQARADLTARNTLALPARAEWLALVDQPEQLAALAASPQFRHAPRFVLGGGSNLVLAGDIAGLTIVLGNKGRFLHHEDDEAFYVAAAAGETWHDFVLWTLTQGYPGLENLALIPGTVGAAPIQNIGAYGLEIGERMDHLTAVDLETGQNVRFSAADCAFGYRQSRFKREGWQLNGRFAVTQVVFRLPKRWLPRLIYAELAAELAAPGVGAPNPIQVAKAVMALRRKKLPDPLELPNAGSFFQNPVVAADFAAALTKAHPQLPCYPQADGSVKLAAGWLIEQAGWKGRNLGPVGMYERQALVLVNRGGASGRDVLRLCRAVREAVFVRFGVHLTPEPTLLGES